MFSRVQDFFRSKFIRVKVQGPALREKCPNTKLFLVCIFLHSAWIGRFHEISVFKPNTGKYGPEKTPYLDTFHAVQVLEIALWIYMEITLRHWCSPVNLLRISEHIFIRTPLKDCFCILKLWFLCFLLLHSFYVSCELSYSSINWSARSSKKIFSDTPWCSVYHYCTTSFNKAWTQVLRRYKSCSWRVRDTRWWGSLTMVPAENKSKHLLLVKHTTKTIHHHRHLRHHHHLLFYSNVT